MIEKGSSKNHQKCICVPWERMVLNFQISVCTKRSDGTLWPFTIIKLLTKCSYGTLSTVTPSL